MDYQWYLLMDARTGPPEGFPIMAKLLERRCVVPPRKPPVQFIAPSP